MKKQLSHDLLQSQKQIQRLILSPQMQQALSLLQLPVLELSSLIEAEMEENPLLEYAEADFFDMPMRPLSSSSKEETDPKTILENTLSYENSLYDHLMAQAKETFSSEKELHLAKMLIGNFDEYGFFTLPVDEIALFSSTSEKELLAILEIIQTFDPVGIGAKNLQHSLLIQLKAQGKNHSIAYQIIENHFEDMLKNRIPQMGKKLGLSPATVKEIIEKEIAKLNLHPAANKAHGHYREIIHHITADVLISDEGTVEINEEKIPPLRFNMKYLSFLKTRPSRKKQKNTSKKKSPPENGCCAISTKETTLYTGLPSRF